MRVLLRATALVLLALAGRAATVWSQSLGEVARQEAERRKTLKPVEKIWTNKDLPSLPPSSPSPTVPVANATKAVEAATKTAEPSKEAPAEAKGEVRDQAYWSGRLKDLRTQLERDQVVAEALQSRINALTSDFVNRDDPAQRAAIENNRQRAIAELARVTQSIEDAREDIASLEEEARRADVPPGWLR